MRARSTHTYGNAERLGRRHDGVREVFQRDDRAENGLPPWGGVGHALTEAPVERRGNRLGEGYAAPGLILELLRQLFVLGGDQVQDAGTGDAAVVAGENGLDAAHVRDDVSRRVVRKA